MKTISIDGRPKYDKAGYRANKAAGLCVDCRQPATPGRVRCAAHLAYAAAKSTEFIRRHPEKVRIGKLRQYGLTSVEYAALLVQQDNRCALCGQPPRDARIGSVHPHVRRGGVTVRGFKRRTVTANLAVDHDHATGKVRALLCTTCNVGLGAFCEDIALLEKAIEYLRRHGLRSVG